MADIYVQPEDVWDYAKEHTADGFDTVIAENPEFGISIYLSPNTEDALPSAYVFLSDTSEEMCNEVLYNQSDAKITVQKMYAEYLDESVAYRIVDFLNESESIDEEEDRQNTIDDRESELDNAFFDLLSIICEDSVPDTNLSEICDFMKELVLDSLYEKYKIDIYRPMILEDENGEEFYEEYPYPCMI